MVKRVLLSILAFGLAAVACNSTDVELGAGGDRSGPRVPVGPGESAPAASPSS